MPPSSSRPTAPRLRVNSEDVDLTRGPPYLSPSQEDGSGSGGGQQTITLHPAQVRVPRKPKMPPAAYPVVGRDTVIAELVANSDPNDISVL